MSRTLTRSGLWASGPRDVTLPVEARGLSELLIASGSLKITPDYDILAWLCERWWNRPTESGWMCPTFYELGQDLYGQEGGQQHRIMYASLRRLAMVSIEIKGFNAETGEADRSLVTYSHLMEVTLPAGDPEGLDRLRVRLSEWLRLLLQNETLRFSWRTLRQFNSRQLLAKRLWLYLTAETYKRSGDSESSWIIAGDRLFAALGMNYGQHRQARAAIRRAAETVMEVDPRFGAGRIQMVKRGSIHQLIVERPTAQTWEQLKKEQEHVRSVIAASGLGSDKT